MDFAFDATERALVDWVSEVAAKRAGSLTDRDADWDAVVDGQLSTPPVPADSLVHRALVVEEASAAGLPALPGARLLVAPEVLDAAPDLPVAVAPARRPGPVRLPPSGGLLLGFDGPHAWISEVTAADVTVVPSSFGYPYAEAKARARAPLPPGSAARIRSRWYLSLGAEIAGTARGALDLTVRHLDSREQFGRRLSSFQALRHRLAELAVSTEAATWLAREAAWRRSTLSAGTALGYARDLAAAMAPELVQLWGARGFAVEHPIHRFAMRLEGLRLEVGAADRLAAAVWADWDQVSGG